MCIVKPFRYFLSLFSLESQKCFYFRLRDDHTETKRKNCTLFNRNGKRNVCFVGVRVLTDCSTAAKFLFFL